MKCPYCGCVKTKVVDKRDYADEPVTRRRRECMKCFKRFTTYERIEKIDLNVMKRDGSVEIFSREKLKKSIFKALANTEVSNEQVYAVVEDIEMKLLNRKDTTVRSSDIGRLVLNRLRGINDVAYLRFASVYKELDSIEDMVAEIESLRKSLRKNKDPK
jgi:transcriptional repressor NrdR